jgi:hypothetical protein
VGGKPPVGMGKDALIDFRMAVALDGETLSAAEIREPQSPRWAPACASASWSSRAAGIPLAVGPLVQGEMHSRMPMPGP